MRELEVCPSTLQSGYKTYSPTARALLFNNHPVSHIFSEPGPDSQAEAINNALKHIGRISLSGVQPKFSVIIDDNKLRFAREREQGTFILKPRPTGYHILNRDHCASNEHVTMQIASQIYKIETSANALCFFDDESMAYITRRFDLHDNGKYKQEDFAALLGYNKDNAGTNYKYDKASYEECAEVIKNNVKASLIDLRRFFQLILFNFITLNDDAHLKNFSLVERNGEYRLSPAYDLINTSIHLREPRIFALDKGLFKEGMSFSDTHSIKRDDFEEFGKRIGLPRKIIKQEIDRFATLYTSVQDLINRSFLSPELKKTYWLSMDYRRKILTF